MPPASSGLTRTNSMAVGTTAATFHQQQQQLAQLQQQAQAQQQQQPSGSGLSPSATNAQVERRPQNVFQFTKRFSFLHRTARRIRHQPLRTTRKRRRLITAARPQPPEVNKTKKGQRRRLIPLQRRAQRLRSCLPHPPPSSRPPLRLLQSLRQSRVPSKR